MLDIFFFAVNSVFPLVGMILLGYFLRQLGFYGDEFVKTANKFVFRLCLPTLLFYNIYRIESIADIRWEPVIFVVCAVTLLFFAGLGIAVLVTKEPGRRGVV